MNTSTDSSVQGVTGMDHDVNRCDGGDTGGTSRLRVDDATIGYDRRSISTGLNVEIHDGAFTAIIGPNGCGKSTLLRSLARVLTPSAGSVLLDGRSISSYRSKEVARMLGLLPQSSLAPDGIRVADLVARGRAPYQSLFQQW
jgi:iron complex transport system ATP-binding protein